MSLCLHVSMRVLIQRFKDKIFSNDLSCYCMILIAKYEMKLLVLEVCVCLVVTCVCVILGNKTFKCYQLSSLNHHQEYDEVSYRLRKLMRTLILILIQGEVQCMGDEMKLCIYMVCKRVQPKTRDLNNFLLCDR